MLGAVVSTLLLWGSLSWVRRRRLRGRRYRAVRFGTRVIVGLSVFLTVALGVNSYAGYFPSFSALGLWLSSSTDTAPAEPGEALGALSERRIHTTATHGVLFQVTIPSSSERVPDSKAWVYLPPGYDQDSEAERYPLVLGLHGNPGKGADWFAGGQLDFTLDTLINARAFPKAIFISPDLSGSAGLDYLEPVNTPGGAQTETFVTKDVVGWVDQNLRTEPDREHRVIAGFSSGGYGSLVLGFRHPDLFGGVISMLPYLDPQTPSIVASEELVGQYEPVKLIRNAHVIPPTFIGMVGEESPKAGDEISAALSEQGAVFTKRMFPAQAHTWVAARTIMPYGLVWIAQQLGWAAPITSDMSSFPTSCVPVPN